MRQGGRRGGRADLERVAGDLVRSPVTRAGLRGWRRGRRQAGIESAGQLALGSEQQRIRCGDERRRRVHRECGCAQQSRGRTQRLRGFIVVRVSNRGEPDSELSNGKGIHGIIGVAVCTPALMPDSMRSATRSGRPNLWCHIEGGGQAVGECRCPLCTAPAVGELKSLIVGAITDDTAVSRASATSSSCRAGFMPASVSRRLTLFHEIGYLMVHSSLGQAVGSVLECQIGGYKIILGKIEDREIVVAHGRLVRSADVGKLLSHLEERRNATRQITRHGACEGEAPWLCHGHRRWRR